MRAPPISPDAAAHFLALLDFAESRAGRTTARSAQ